MSRWYMQCRGMRPSNCLLSSSRPWDNLDDLFGWCWQWSQKAYEWPIVTAFVVPLIAEFLISKGFSEENVSKIFKMEFTTGGRKDKFVPTCFWRKSLSESISIGKLFQGKFMCADFIFLPPLPPVVAEVKVGVPRTSKKIFSDFQRDLKKCEEWLAPDVSPYIQKKFQIDRFEYALAILIDLTQGREVRNSWKAAIREEDYISQGIVPFLISPAL